MKVVLSPTAERHLYDMRTYIAEQSGDPDRAQDYVDRLVALCLSPEVFPERGRTRDDVAPGLRSLSFEGRATVMYRIEHARVVIRGVFYGGRDVAAAGSD